MSKICDTTNEYNETVNSNEIVIVAFSASWCEKSKQVAPQFECLAKKYTAYKFLKVDIDDLAEVAVSIVLLF